MYDIHGNLPALEAVLAEIARIGVDRVVVGGDLVPGPLFDACLQRLRQLAVPTDFIHGNGESAVLGLRRGGSVEALPEQAREIVGWVANVLRPEDEQEIARWPPTMPIAPAAAAMTCAARSFLAATAISPVAGSRASNANASACSPSPARIAMPSP